MKRIHLTQRSNEWKKFRDSRIGSTDCPIILCMSPYKNPVELFYEKEGVIDPPPPTAAMVLGTDLEEVALQRFNALNEVEFKPDVVVHDDYDFIMSSLDGITEDGKEAVEIKCGKKAFEEASKGHVNPLYFCQCQHHLYVTGLEEIHLFYYWETKYIWLRKKRS